MTGDGGRDPDSGQRRTTGVPDWRDLAIMTERVAVELNLEILDRRDFDRRSLSEGDRVEILSFIGGGTPGAARENEEGAVHV